MTNHPHTAARHLRAALVARGADCGPLDLSVNRNGQASAYFDLSYDSKWTRVRVSDHDANMRFRVNETHLTSADAGKADDLIQALAEAASRARAAKAKADADLKSAALPHVDELRSADTNAQHAAMCKIVANYATMGRHDRRAWRQHVIDLLCA